MGMILNGISISPKRIDLIERIIPIQDSDEIDLYDNNGSRIYEGSGVFAPALMPTSLSKTTITTGTIDGRDWHGRASMVELSNGVWVLVYRSAPSHSDNGDAVLRIRFSDDYGATWTDEDTKLGGGGVTGFPMTPPGGGTGSASGPGEPWLYLADNGTLILHMWLIDYSTTRGGTYQTISTDGGETWSTPATQVSISGETDDYVFITDDDFIFNGDIYAGARVYPTDPDGDPSRSILIKSTNNGSTWSKVSTIQDVSEGGTGAQEVGLEYLGDDNIIAMLRDNPHTNSYKRLSDDLGATWGSLIAVGLTTPVDIASRQRVFTVAHLKGEDSWWDDNNLIMVGFVHLVSGSSVQRGNCIWTSDDAGATWHGPFWLDSGVEDAGYGDILYDPDNDEFVVVINYGTQGACSLVQYRFKLLGVD